MEPTNVTLGREQKPEQDWYSGRADGSISALVESGLRAAEQGDDAHADAQVFALPPEARAEYRQLLAARRLRRAVGGA